VYTTQVEKLTRETKQLEAVVPYSADLYIDGRNQERSRQDKETKKFVLM
ncbi:unnamed protein product, partial [Brassica oleracea var. botrytis]